MDAGVDGEGRYRLGGTGAELQYTAARRIERELRSQVGAEAFEGLLALLEALGGEEDQPGMRDYLRRALRLAGDTDPA